MSETKPIGLWQAVAEAQRALKSIAKNRTSGEEDSRFTYDYVSADAMIHFCREALLENGVVYSLLGVREDVAKRMSHLVFNKATKQTVEMPICWLVATHKVTHSSGETFEWTTEQAAVVSNGRPVDKAFVAAGTVATREALRFLLNVPRKNDDEPEQRDDSDYGNAPPRHAEKPAPAPKPSPTPTPTPAKAEPPRAFTDAELRHTKNVTSDAVWDVGTVIEAKMSTGEKNGKAWTRYAITLDATDGEMACSTFDKDLGTTLARWRAKGAQCSFATVKRGKYYDIVGVEPIDDRPPAPAPAKVAAPSADDDLPF